MPLSSSFRLIYRGIAAPSLFASTVVEACSFVTFWHLADGWQVALFLSSFELEQNYLVVFVTYRSLGFLSP
jgi:hypothetical protein